MKNVSCANDSVTNAFECCSNGKSTRIPYERPRRAAFAPSLAACIRPGPPPVMMSQPIAASVSAMRLVSVYAFVRGRIRADPKIDTR